MHLIKHYMGNYNSLRIIDSCEWISTPLTPIFSFEFNIKHDDMSRGTEDPIPGSLSSAGMCTEQWIILGADMTAIHVSVCTFACACVFNFLHTHYVCSVLAVYTLYEALKFAKHQSWISCTIWNLIQNNQWHTDEDVALHGCAKIKFETVWNMCKCFTYKSRVTVQARNKSLKC